MNRTEWIEEKGEKVGMKVRMESVKNKTFVPFRSATINVMFFDVERGTGGIDLLSDLVTNAIELGIVKKSGSWLNYNGMSIQGEAKLRQALVEDPDLASKVKADIVEVINGGRSEVEESFSQEED